MGGLATGAEGKGLHKSPGVPGHVGPLQVLTKEGQRTLSPWVTGKEGGMHPLESLGTYRMWDKRAAIRGLTCVRLGNLRCLYASLKLPGNGGHQAGRRKSRLILLGSRLQDELPGQSVRLDFAGPVSIREGKTEPTHNQKHPPPPQTAGTHQDSKAQGLR